MAHLRRRSPELSFSGSFDSVAAAAASPSRCASGRPAVVRGGRTRRAATSNAAPPRRRSRITAEEFREVCGEFAPGQAGCFGGAGASGGAIFRPVLVLPDFKRSQRVLVIPLALAAQRAFTLLRIINSAR